MLKLPLKKRISSLITVPCVGKVAQTKQFNVELLQICIKLDEFSHCPHAKQRYGLYLVPSEAKTTAAVMRCRTGGGTGRKEAALGITGQVRWRKERQMVAGPDKGTRHEGAGDTDGRTDGRVTETEVTFTMEWRASVTGLTRDST